MEEQEHHKTWEPSTFPLEVNRIVPSLGKNRTAGQVQCRIVQPEPSRIAQLGHSRIV